MACAEAVPNREEDSSTDGSRAAVGVLAEFGLNSVSLHSSATRSETFGRNQPFPSDFWACPQPMRGSPDGLPEVPGSRLTARKYICSKMESGGGTVVRFDSRRRTHIRFCTGLPGVSLNVEPGSRHSARRGWDDRCSRRSLLQPSVHDLAPYRSNLSSRLWQRRSGAGASAHFASLAP